MDGIVVKQQTREEDRLPTSTSSPWTCSRPSKHGVFWYRRSVDSMSIIDRLLRHRLSVGRRAEKIAMEMSMHVSMCTSESDVGA